MLTIFFLIAVSIFVPSFWIVTVSYITYLIVTRKQRRDKIIMHEITQSITQKRERVHLEHLYFASAQSFAVDHGATVNDLSEDRLDIELNIDGEDYQITLQRQENDETLLFVSAAENVKGDQKSVANEEELLFKDSA